MKKGVFFLIVLASLASPLLCGIQNRLCRNEWYPRHQWDDLGFRAHGAAALLAPMPGNHGEGASILNDALGTFIERLVAAANETPEKPTPEENRTALAASTAMSAASTLAFVPSIGGLLGLPLSVITSKILNCVFLDTKTSQAQNNGLVIGTSLACVYWWTKGSTQTN